MYLQEITRRSFVQAVGGLAAWFAGWKTKERETRPVRRIVNEQVERVYIGGCGGEQPVFGEYRIYGEPRTKKVYEALEKLKTIPGN